MEGVNVVTTLPILIMHTNRMLIKHHSPVDIVSFRNFIHVYKYIWKSLESVANTSVMPLHNLPLQSSNSVIVDSDQKISNSYTIMLLFPQFVIISPGSCLTSQNYFEYQTNKIKWPTQSRKGGVQHIWVMGFFNLKIVIFCLLPLIPTPQNQSNKQPAWDLWSTIWTQLNMVSPIFRVFQGQL